MKILIVDDSALIRRLIRQEIDEKKYEVYEAHDGLEAVKMVGEIQPDLITMDVDMPKLNGYEAAHKIRTEIKSYSEGDKRQAPIIFVTASDTIEGRKKGFEVGASDFIVKPFTKGEVSTAVEHLLSDKSRLKGLTALVAEDSKIPRFALERILQSEGINSIIAVDGKEAFDLFKKHEADIDIVITDFIMPIMNGDELCHKIRTETENRRVPIIFLSAMSEQKSILQIFKAGASDYIIKPFVKEELISRIKVHLETRTLNRKLIGQVHELKRLGKLKDDFLAITSHDLRSPLTGILGFTELLLEDEDLNKKHKEYLKNVIDSGEFLLNLINDILDLGRVQSENHDLVKSTLSVEDIINSTTNTIRHMATPKQINLEVENKCSEQPYILGEKSSLIRIFNNLLSNAIKFTPKNGSVKQRIEQEDENSVTISVIDSGIGIPEDKIPLLFDRFSKISRLGTAGEKSTGLGMSITKELIDSHDATIDVTSEVGKGSCFKVKFPLVKNVVKRSNTSDSKDNGGFSDIEDSKVRILLADDNQLNVKLATTLLNKKGYQVNSTNDGKGVLEAYKNSINQVNESGQVFDIIFMDLEMPIMHGYEATNKIRKFEKKMGIQPIPIIAMTASDKESWEKKGRAVGMNGYVTKPLNRDQITKVIQQLLFIDRN